MRLSELKQKTIKDLIDLATEHAIDGASSMRRQDLVFAILREQSRRGGDLHAEGVLEILPDGFGFLRAPDHNYLPGADDIYVSPSQIRRFDLRTGDRVAGLVRPPKESERYFALLRVEAVNGADPDARPPKLLFDNLTPTYPVDRWRLAPGGTAWTRVVDCLVPIGKGQRCLIEAPPRAGRTRLITDLAAAIERNHPDAALTVLLVDERPEDVTELKRAIAAEVVASTFDEPAARHVQVADVVLEKAKRLAESGRDAVIVVDSLSRLVRAYAATDPSAPHRPMRFFGAARNLEEAGSLTIVATAQVGTGDPRDDAIARELRAAATCEIVLSSELAARGIEPSIDLSRSATRKAERLLSDDEQRRAAALRDELHVLSPDRAVEVALARLGA
ncbi:MAG: transcription termination factor Rho [Deltaproteobacteria bacterium]|nr:MAG: transcription termination factor Rho [Deltaproteobacteria bacterium]